MSGRIQWMLVAVLMLSAGFSGCFDDGKDDGGEKQGWSLFERNGSGEDEVVPVEAYEHYLRNDPADGCEGCISLEKPAPEPKVATKPPPPSVQIPFPMAGDRLNFHGETGGRPARDVAPLPSDADGRYAGVLRVLAGAEGHARFQFGLMDAYWIDAPGHPAAHVVDWNVSLESRLVTSGSALGYIHFSGDLYREDRSVRKQLDPRLETLFWAGAHVWGRTLSAGDAFTIHAEVPATDGGHLVFAYEVLRVAPNGVSSHGGVQSSPSALLRVTVTDPFGMSAQWQMSFQTASPYPVEMHTRSMHPSDHVETFLPAVAHTQSFELRERGREPLAWVETMQRPSARAAPEDAGFVLGERPASMALDLLPLYPLHTALSDLALLDNAYGRFAAAQPDRVIIHATYRNEPLTEQVHRAAWNIVFTDREGGVAAWSVARVAVAGVLGPAAHTQQIALFVDPRLVDALTEAGDVVRLALGTAAVERLAAMGIEQVDLLEYRLRLDGDGVIGGSLSAYRHHLDAVAAVAQQEAVPLGHVIQDLATRTVTESAAYVRSY